MILLAIAAAWTALAIGPALVVGAAIRVAMRDGAETDLGWPT